jgi:hypothetical protein
MAHASLNVSISARRRSHGTSPSRNPDGAAVRIHLDVYANADASRWQFRRAGELDRFARRRVGDRWFVDETYAPTYPRVLDEMLPAAWHDVERYANNRVEADHVR